ncbi:MAG: ATP-binding protein [Syntrophales bacterium]
MPFNRFNTMPIRKKLIFVSLITMAVAVGIMSLFLLVREIVTFRTTFLERLTAQADMAGYNVKAALVFEVHKDAEEAIAALGQDRNILSVAVYDRQGKVFVKYNRDVSNASFALSEEPKETFDWLGGFVQIVEPVVVDGEPIGSILVRSSLIPFYNRLAGYIVMSLIAMLIAMGIGFGLATRLGKLIARPILQITDVMQLVATRKDFRLRVKSDSRDEIGFLAGNLNEMLSQIQARDEELEEHRHNLEKLVLLRTDALEKANRRLTEELQHRKHTEEDLLRLATAIEQSAEGIYLADPNWIILYTNPAFDRMLGYEPRELLGWHTRLLKSGMHDRDFYRNIRETLARGEIWTGRAFNKRKDGTIIPIEATLSPVRDGSGRIINYVSSHHDISLQLEAEAERKALQDRLQRAEKMEALGTLAGGVAHDLNNVIGVLVGYSELLLIKSPEGSPLKAYADQILQGGQRAAAIIQDLLTLARRGVTVSEVLNLNPVITEFMRSPELEKIRSYNPSVRIDVHLDQGLMNIRGSRIHLTKTAMNLILNAVEAISGEGRVTVRTENVYLDTPLPGYEGTKEGEYVVLSVADSGVGIPPENLDHIFEPFYTKKVMGRSGTGLGLAVVWGTVKDHDGYINVKSEVGRGTTFLLYFPLCRESLAEQQATVSRREYEGRGERILVVDDVEGQRNLAVSMLESLGYAVRAVASGEEAVQHLKKEPADLVVLDMIMDPGWDGLETWKEIVRLHPRQKAIIVSGYALTERVREAQALGAGTYIRKPYVMEQIGMAVRRELQQTRETPGAPIHPGAESQA